MQKYKIILNSSFLIPNYFANFAAIASFFFAGWANVSRYLCIFAAQFDTKHWTWKSAYCLPNGMNRVPCS